MTIVLDLVKALTLLASVGYALAVLSHAA